MSKRNKKIVIPTFLEVFLKQRIQVVTPKGGAHLSKKEYNRKCKDFLKEWD